jgi:predicted transposase/invertase (TIGR01784 family)
MIKKSTEFQLNTGILELDSFADPTYDATFKMLFGDEKNKDILISILNSFLDFTGDKEITEVNISSNEFIPNGSNGIQGSVDVLCTTKNNQKIAVEMQRKYKDYFLPRSQEYMSKIIAGQVKEGDGDKYDKVLMDTYVISIGKQNIFRGKYELNDKNIFEETVVPWVKETNQEIPGNKMYWKFFELPKFIKSYKSKQIDASSSLKEQWLDFLVKCGTQKEVPSNISDIIKKGYNIMKMANWTEDQRVLYWKQKANEIDELKEQERLNEELKQEAEKFGFEKGEVKGEVKGKWKGEIKGEISKFKDFQKLGLKEEQYKDMFKHLKQDNFPYIQEHIDDTESVIMGGMDIEYPDHI